MAAPGAMKVALLMLVVGDLAGSGGAERYFADMFRHLRKQGRVETYLVTSRSSLRPLEAAGRITSTDGIIALPLGRRPGAGVLGLLWTTLVLLWTTARHRFDVVHICLPTPTYVPYAALVTLLPARLRPRVTVNVIDCTVAANLRTRQPADLYEQQVLAAHRLYTRWTRLDGVFSWYGAFIETARGLKLFSPHTALMAARYCFADMDRFMPAAEKENVIVFAGRLSSQKRPLLFVEAVARLCADHPQLVHGWRFEMYGRGDLYTTTKERIAALGLTERVTLTHAIDMAPVFARSRAFVSTQSLENFTSLAMLEAMASGNAIIAADVGQTSEFVRHGENGFLVQDETPAGFARALAEYLRDPARHEEFASASRILVLKVHTIDNAAEDVVSFWRHVIAPTPAASPADHQPSAS